MTRSLVAPTRRPIILKRTRPNVGVEAEYRKRIMALVEAMHRSLAHWVEAQYRATPPDTIAEDAARERDTLGGGPGGAHAMRSIRAGAPVPALQRTMNKLATRWQKQFDAGSQLLAEWFAQQAMDRSDVQLRSILRKAGFSVEFKLTPPVRDAYQAVIAENVGLIRSIAEQHLTQVQGAVMRSVTEGRDLATLTDELQQRYQITRRRAALIARDQNNKATAVITKERQRGLGLTTAIWRHSGAGKEPRPSHVAADGKTYDVDKGMYIDGKWIWPGTEINCRCTAQAVIPGFDDE